MEEKKDKIEKIRKQSIRKRKHKEIAIGAISAVLILSASFYGFQEVMNEAESETQRDYSKEIVISGSIQPYRTSITSNETVKFTNRESETLRITFETNSIKEPLVIEPNSSSYFDASVYSNIPKTNYFNTNSGDNGQIIIQN